MTTLPISKRLSPPGHRPAPTSGLLLCALLLVGGWTPSAFAQGQDDAAAPPPPELLIQARTPQGEPVELDRADLLLVAFGDEKMVELPTEGSSVRVPMTREWLCEAWPERCDELARAMIFLGAEGRVLVGSEPFRWPGVGRKPQETVQVEFPGDVSTRVGGPGTRVVQVGLREPGIRTLRVVDQVGNPLAGVEVEFHVFHNHLNTCGELVAPDLGTGTTDEEGLVQVPDGDFRYAFVFRRPHYILKEAQSTYHPNRWITRLELPETLVVLEELAIDPLDLRVVDDGEPVAQVALYGCRAACQPNRACNESCCGPLSEPTGEEGRIRLPEFRPEEYERVYLVNPRGDVLWETYPRQWRGEGAMEVDLAGRWTPME